MANDLIAKKKIAIRRCIVTKQKLPKAQLIRIVINKNQEIFVDNSQKASGSGIYIQPKIALIIKAKKTKVFEKVLKTKINSELYDEIIKVIENNQH